MLDGTPTLRLNEFMLGGIQAGKIPLELPEGEKARTPMSKPEEIVFELDKHLEDVIAKSKKGFGEEMALQDLEVSQRSLRNTAGHSQLPRVEVIDCLLDGAFPRVREECYQDIQGITGCVGSNDQTARFLSPQITTRCHLRILSNP